MAINEPEATEIEELRTLLHATAAENERLRAQLSERSDRVSRRGIVKGLGLSSLVALGAAGASMAGGVPSVLAAPGGAVESSDLAGELTALLNLKLSGKDVVGDATGIGRAGAIEVLYYQSDVKSPRDAATGQATGKRQYAPIIIRKRIDKASPLLSRALATNEAGEGTIRFFRSGRGPDQFYTVALTGLHVVSIQQLLPDTNKSAGEVSTPPIEEVQFVFQKITWTYVDGGVTASDDWETPVA